MEITAEMESNTDQLVRMAQAGDKSAQRQLLTRHQDRLKRMIATFLDPRVAPRVDPSDVLQETLAHAARRLPAYRNDRPAGFYPWLRQIAKDRIIDAHRKHIRAEKRSVKRETRDDSYLSPDSASRLVERLVSQESSPSLQARNSERRDQMIAALSRLSESYRELLLMRFVEQLSTREIAEIMSTTESAVKSKLWRALEKLNQVAGGELEDRE